MSEHVPEWVHMAEVPPTDTDPSPRRPSRPDTTQADDDEDSGLWAGVALMLSIALIALVIGIAIGRLTA